MSIGGKDWENQLNYKTRKGIEKEQKKWSTIICFRVYDLNNVAYYKSAQALT